MTATAETAGGEYQPQLEVDGPARQRRLTVLVRLLLLIPQYVVLYILSLAAGVVLVISWFAALVLGRLPGWSATFLNGYLSWTIRVRASTQLLVDRYPPFDFTAPQYPARVYVEPGRLNRLAVFFRLILVIPAAIINLVITYGWGVCAFFCWLAVLVTGRVPGPLFEATAAVVRYHMRYAAYYMMLTSAYPRDLFGDLASADPASDVPSSPESARGDASSGASAAHGGTRPLVLSTGGRALLLVFVVVGALSVVGISVSTVFSEPGQPGAQTSTY